MKKSDLSRIMSPITLCNLAFFLDMLSHIVGVPKRRPWTLNQFLENLYDRLNNRMIGFIKLCF